MNRRINIEILLAKGKTATSRSKKLCETSRALRKESKALIQRAEFRAMDGGIVLPKKPPKRAA